MAAALRGAGFDPDRIDEARLDPAGVHALVELHIEQGAVLESAGESIGVVTAIAAPHDLRVVFGGAATHSGATPMRLRRDALAGAAEWMVALERAALDSPSGSTVATVGVLGVRPGAINVVPGEARLDVDVRDSDRVARDVVVSDAIAEAEAIAARRGLALTVTTIVEDAPVQCAPAIVDAIEAACGALRIPARRMISGAYHDAMVIGSSGIPIGMLFVPSARGISHHPGEFTEAADVDRGVAVLAAALARLSG
jgi:hydantoinase/carbamoylase family amidase